MRASGWAPLALTNCGRKAKKKIESFGLRMLIRMAETITWLAERGPALAHLEWARSLSVRQAM